MRGLTAVIMIVMLIVIQAACGAVTTGMVSVNSSGVPADGASMAASVSSDGRYVAYWSDGDNLVSGDTNGVRDVFVLDKQTGVVERVSGSSGDPGTQANGPSCENVNKYGDIGEWETPSITPDGRYVVFSSSATNLVSGDTNNLRDVFVRDRVAKTTVRVSISSSGGQGNGASFFPSISADGARVAFVSDASNIVPSDHNGAPDVFVRDLASSTTTRINLSPSGSEATGQIGSTDYSGLDGNMTAWISGDGKHVAFSSNASNLIETTSGWPDRVFVRDLDTAVTECVSVSTSGVPGDGFSWERSHYINYDGTIVTFDSYSANLVPDDTNNAHDAFVRDRVHGTTTRYSVAIDGSQLPGGADKAVCSGDGGTLCFDTSTDGGNTFMSYAVNRDGTGMQRVALSSSGWPLPGVSGMAVPNYDGRLILFVNGTSTADFASMKAFISDRSSLTITAAKSLGNDATVSVNGGFVVGAFPGEFYIQQDKADKSVGICAIRVEWSGAVTVGMRYVVVGTLKTNLDGERYILATSVTPKFASWLNDVKPVFMPNKSIGGGDWKVSGTAGQTGVTGGSGLNNIGLLVRTTGKMTILDSTTFTIDDGSGVNLRCVVPSSISLSSGWQIVAVNGISSIRKNGSTYERLLKVVSIDPLMPTSDEITIRALFATAKSTAEAHDVNGFMALFSPNYLHFGTNLSTLQPDVASGIGKLTRFDYNISAISVTGTTAQVSAAITVTNSDGSTSSWNEPDTTGDSLGMGWLAKINNIWLINGSQQQAIPWVRANVGHNMTPRDDHYFLRMKVDGTNVTGAVVSGPHIPTTTLPVDTDLGGYKAFIDPSQLPNPGDRYTFDISFSDGHHETWTDDVVALIDAMPNYTLTPGPNNSLTWTWSDMRSQVQNISNYMLTVDGLWRMDAASNRTSAVFNEDGTASGPLLSGHTYSTSFSIFNQHGDYSYLMKTITMP